MFSTDSRSTQLSPAGIDLVPVTSMETLPSTVLGIRSDAVCTSHVIAVGNVIFLITLVVSRVKYMLRLQFASCNGYGESLLKYDDQ